MISSRHNISSPSRADTTLARLTGGIALAVAVLLGLVLMLLGRESWPILAGGDWMRFFSGDGWFPASGQFNF